MLYVRALAAVLMIAAIVGGWAYVQSLKTSLAAERQLSEAREQARATAINSLNQARKAHDQALVALQELERKRAEDARRISQLRREISNAPDGGCVGPAVRGVLDGLRQE